MRWIAIPPHVEVRLSRTAPITLALSIVVALAACEQDRPAPMDPAAGSSASAAGVTEAVSSPVVEDGACPCWTGRSLAAAFPAASFWFDDLAAENQAGRAALQLSDVANARVLQALAEFDPQATSEGDNWCQVATFGQTGLERESISALKITAEEFSACVTLLNDRAVATDVAAD